MAKAPDLSPRALSLVDKLLARLPASVSDLETWWERQGKVTRLELRRILRQLDGDRLAYDRDAGMVKPLDLVTARAGRGGVKAGDLVAVSPTGKASRAVTVTVAPTPEPAAPVSVPAPRAEDFTVTLGTGKVPPLSQDGAVAMWPRDESGPVVMIVGNVGIRGPRADVKKAADAYLRTDPRSKPSRPLASLVVDGLTFSGEHEDEVAAAAAAYIADLPKLFATVSGPSARSLARVAKPRQSRPVTGSVSERVRASVCRKPGTVAEVIARFPEVNPNTIRGALGTLKAKGLVGHKGGKYGAPRG